jgi:hypothetical protein
MNVVERPDHPFGAIVLAILFWAFSASFAHAEGYWACAAGGWVAIGDPQHAMPLKSCGSHLEMPDTQLACEQVGGSWGRAGIFPKPICKMPTHDAGRPCADLGECEGLCIADLTPEQRDLVIKGQKLQVPGQCSPYSPIFGCLAIVEKGLVARIMCRD